MVTAMLWGIYKVAKNYVNRNRQKVYAVGADSDHLLEERILNKTISETGKCTFAPTCLALPLYQGLSWGDTQKSTQAIVS